MSLTYKVPVYIEVSGDIESLKRYIFSLDNVWTYKL